MAEAAGPGGMLGNMHADVLNHKPENDAQKQTLLEEIKRRAKGAFQAKDMPSCDLLYSKAIELSPKEPTLFSNRAMVYLNLGKVEEAVKDCDSCLKLDSTMIKAYYRKAQAQQRLGNWDAALEAIAQGKGVKEDPSFDTLLAEVQKNQAKDLEAKRELRREAQDTANAEKPQAPVSVASMVERKKQREAAATEGEDLSMKGYRTKADGSKTTFFHTDISDEAKALLEAQGTKPVKLEAPVVDEQDAQGKSTWNKAGTWENKNMKKWVSERLDAWSSLNAPIMTPGGTPGSVMVTKTEWEGTAEIVMARGKKKRVMDICITVTYSLTITGTDEKATGKLIYQDVTTDEELDVRFEPDSASTPAARPLAEIFVKGTSEGLQPLLAPKLEQMLAEFKDL